MTERELLIPSREAEMRTRDEHVCVCVCVNTHYVIYTYNSLSPDATSITDLFSELHPSGIRRERIVCIYLV